MQDFYNSIPDFNERKDKDLQQGFISTITNPTPELQQRSDFDFRSLHTAIRNYPIDEWTGFDWLSNRYPRYKDRIQEARNKGIPDRIIAKVFAEQLEPRLNFVGNQEQVNNFLGRTQLSMQMDRRYEEAKRFNAYRQAFPDKSEQEIADALWLAQDSGVQATALLRNPELAKKLARGRPMHYQIFGDKRDTIPEGWSTLDIFMDRMFPTNSPFRIGANNFLRTQELGELGKLVMDDKISRQEALHKKQEIMQKYLPQPVNQGGLYPYLEGAASIATQGYSTGTKSGLVLLAGSMAAGPLGLPAAAGQIGALLTAANELWKLSAGNKYLELLEMKDKEGKPIDEGAAKTGAIFDGLVTVAAEMIGLPVSPPSVIY